MKMIALLLEGDLQTANVSIQTRHDQSCRPMSYFAALKFASICNNHRHYNGVHDSLILINRKSKRVIFGQLREFKTML